MRSSWNLLLGCAGLAAALLLASARAAAPAATAGAEPQAQLRLCLPDLEATPYLNAVDQPPGLIERVLVEAARQTGMSLRISRAPIRRCTLQLQQGEIDGLIAGWNAANQELARFPMKGDAVDAGRRIVRVSTVWVQRRNSALQWDGQRFNRPDGEPVTVGSLRAVAVVANALRMEGYRLEDSSSSIRQLLLQLRARRFDAAVGLADQVQHELADGRFDDLEVLPGTAAQHDFYVVFRHERFAASSVLIESFWDRIARVREMPAFQPPR